MSKGLHEHGDATCHSGRGVGPCSSETPRSRAASAQTLHVPSCTTAPPVSTRTVGESRTWMATKHTKRERHVELACLYVAMDTASIRHPRMVRLKCLSHGRRLTRGALFHGTLETSPSSYAQIKPISQGKNRCRSPERTATRLHERPTRGVRDSKLSFFFLS